MHWLDGYLGAAFARWGYWALLFWLIVYVLALATPFVPGVEISFAVMLLLGSKGIVAMYLATLLGLSLASAVGRQVPLRSIAAMLRWLRLERADRLVQTMAQLPSDQQLN